MEHVIKKPLVLLVKDFENKINLESLKGSTSCCREMLDYISLHVTLIHQLFN